MKICQRIFSAMTSTNMAAKSVSNQNLVFIATSAQINFRRFASPVFDWSAGRAHLGPVVARALGVRAAGVRSSFEANFHFSLVSKSGQGRFDHTVRQHNFAVLHLVLSRSHSQELFPQLFLTCAQKPLLLRIALFFQVDTQQQNSSQIVLLFVFYFNLATAILKARELLIMLPSLLFSHG